MTSSGKENQGEMKGDREREKEIDTHTECARVRELERNEICLWK